MEVTQEPMGKSTQGSISNQMLHTFTVCTFYNTCTIFSGRISTMLFLLFCFEVQNTARGRTASWQRCSMFVFLEVTLSHVKPHDFLWDLMSVESLPQAAGVFWTNRAVCALRSYRLKNWLKLSLCLLSNTFLNSDLKIISWMANFNLWETHR